MSSDAQTPPQPDEFWQGIAEFNSGEFYACHDTLEALWIEAMEPDKTFYQGILQVAVGIYHLSNLNWRGAAILIGEGLNRLNRYEGDYAGIDVDQLIHDSAALLRGLQTVGEAQVGELAIALNLIPAPQNTTSSTSPLEISADVVLPKIHLL